MEQKKTCKADLENKRSYFVLIGLVLSLGMTLLAFEWKTEVNAVETLGTLESTEIEEEIIPIVRDEPKVEEATPPKQMILDALLLVDNETEILDEPEIESSEAGPETLIEIVPIIKQDDEIVEDAKIWVTVDEMPEFPGGKKALSSFVSKNLKYPIVAQENGIQGTVLLTFVVDQNGNVTDTKVVRSADDALDKEAMRVINSMPQWKPGKQGGTPVKVHYSHKITFRLE